MKIVCEKEKLISVLNQAERITSKNLSLPVLAEVMIVVKQKESELVFFSTNLDLGAEFHLKVKIEKSEEGEEKKITVKAGALAQFLSNTVSEKEVTIEIQGNILFVKTKSGTAKFIGSEAGDFPEISKIDTEQNFTIEAFKICDGIKSTSYSASVSQIKPELSGIFIYAEGDNLIFVATDSFRLAEKKIKIKNLKKEIENLILPAKNAQEIVKILEPKGSDDVEIKIGGGKISFKAGDAYLVSRLIEGSFPDYKQIIPKEQKTEAIFLKEDLLRALKASTVFSDSFNQIIFDFQPKNKKVEIFSKNSGVGEGTLDISAALSGEDAKIGFNHKYILEALAVIKSDSVSMSLSGMGRPAIIRGVSENSFMGLIMPMNR